MLQMLLEGASAAGHEIDLVFFEPGPWPDELTDAGFHVEVIPAGRLRQPHRLLATDWMTKTHVYGAPAAVLARMSDRVVWWQHGTPDGGWLERTATMLPAVAIGCCTAVAARAQAEMFPSRPTFVVAAGARVPDARSAPAPLELPADVTVVGIVGRLQPWKGQDRLLRAQALLRERGQRMHLVIVGGDAYGLSTDYAASLPGLVRQLGLEGSVTMTGQVADAGPYIEQFDILVNASDPEPFGLVLLEGMARGVAVVAVDSGGPGEFIEDQRTGALADSGAPSALADALEPLLSSPARRRVLGEAGRERFMRDFTDTAMRKRFFEELESLGAGQSTRVRAC
jgi:glycosyltransferase involved in cell wall biosynthesis